MAYNDIPWGHLTVHEVGWAIRCEKFTYCSNEKKSKACRQLLKDEETTPEVRVAAMEALGKLYETHKGSKDELLTPTEIGKIRDTLMWEVAMSSENHTKKAASGVLERLVNDNNNSAQCEKSMKCACQLHRLRSDDPDEKKDAINILAREHPEFASAYVRDLAKLLTYVPRRRHNSGEGESQHGESHCKVEEEQRDKEWYNARRVREAAARALGSLCEAKAPDKNQELTEDQQKDQQKQRQDSVYKVADIVLEALCNEECPFISRTALTAVVGFRDEAAVRAVNRVMKLGKSAESLHCRGVAEIALVELLPRLPPNELQERADEVAQWLLDSDGNRSDMARRVLERLGGKAAEAAQGALSKLPRESQRTVRGLQELEAVLRCQAESAKSLEGTSIRGLNLVLRTDEDQLKRAREMVDKIAGMRGNVWGEIFKLLEAENIQHKTKGMSTDTETGTLPVFITDLEVDDTMFIAEMWAYLREQGQGRGVHKPLVVFCADVEHKDKEDLFAMKLLFAALMLGRVDFKILTAQPKPGQEAKKSELAADLAKQREGNIRDIADKIMQFRGEKVAYFICSPTRGNLEDIMVKLAVDPKEDKGKAKKDNGAKPTLREPEKRSVHMYTGMFNMKETTDEDIKALYTLVGKDTFIDLSKYPFFGYRESVVTNFTDFALPSFAPLLSHRYTLIAAVWRLLNDAFNTKLVSPEKVMEKVLPPDLEEKFSEAKVHYAKDMNKYAEILCTPKLLEHVVNKKKNTLKAFACGSCDVPLCDQLLFLREWARDHQPPVPRDLNNRPETEGTWISEISGTWVYNKKDGYTSVDTRPEVETMGLKAVQPVMREHRDAEALYRMREALQDYTFKHLELLYGENRC